MKAHVTEACIGCEACVSICPAVFEMAGSVAVAKDIVPQEQEELCKEAALNCPVEAIIIE